VVQNPKALKAVLVMIIVDGVVVSISVPFLCIPGRSSMIYTTCYAIHSLTQLYQLASTPLPIRKFSHGPQLTLTQLHTSTTIVRFAAYYGNDQPQFRAAWSYIEKFQMTVFMLQECLISAIYLYETTKLLRIMKRNTTRRTISELFAINVFIIALDIGLLVVEYLNLLVYEQTFKGAIYSIKLKLEFAILGKLVKIVRNGKHVLANLDEDTPGFVDMTVTRQQSTDAGAQHGPPSSIGEDDFRRYSVAAGGPGGKALVSSQHLEEFNAKGYGV
jgi:hypothetical protein